MRDSRVPWLGDVPAHWEVRRNGRLFAQRIETGLSNLPILEVSLRTGVRVRDFEASSRKQMMGDREKYKRARKGDIAYNMMRMWQGAVGVAPVDGLVSPAYVVAQPVPEASAQYFQHVFRTDAYMNGVNKFSRGIVADRNRLYWEDFKQMASPFPPPDEQAAIVRLLDHVDGRIGRYIRAKKKLIKLLGEQKQAIIHGAVTRGLDPNTRLKPSGVEWLGGVPEHWGMSRLKRVAAVQTGVTLGKIYRDASFLVERPYLRVANVQAGRLSLSRVTSVRVPLSEARGATLRRGDVLMTEGGDIDKLGRGCVWYDEIPGCLHQNHIFAVRPQVDRLLPEFLVALLGSTHGRRYFQVTAKQTTNLAATNSTTLGNFPVLLPDVKEQERILDAIAQEVSPAESAISRAEREIGFLREYLRRLVADVVTGKFDVREAAGALPAQGDDAESHQLTPGGGEREDAMGEGDDEDLAAEEAEA